MNYSVMKTTRSLLGLSLLICATECSYSSSIQIYGYANAGEAAYKDQTMDSASASDKLLWSGSVGDTYSSVTYAARAAVGDLGLSYSGHSACNPGGGCDTANGQIIVRNSDTLTVSGAPSSGSIKLDFLLEGSYSATSTFVGSVAAPLSVTYAIHGLDPALGGGYSVGVSCDFATACIAESGFPVSPQRDLVTFPDEFSLMFPYTASKVFLSQELEGNFLTCTNCDVVADFYHSAKVGGAVVFDANGNLVSGASITSDSGFDYVQPLAQVTSAPEPITTGLVFGGIGAVAFLGMRRRKELHARTLRQVRASSETNSL